MFLKWALLVNFGKSEVSVLNSHFAILKFWSWKILKDIESVLVFFYARLSLKHNSRTKRFSRLSSAGHALGKKQNSAKFMSNHYASSDCFFSDQFLVTTLVLLAILNFHFAYFLSDLFLMELKITQGQIWILLAFKIWNCWFERIILCNMLFSSEKSFCLGKNLYHNTRVEILVIC